ncbi:MAG: hypothetical protein LBU80_00685 [Rikenellaceae bacterium]|jgi:fatty acid desaturase|nr:hypothetical protein [Rikenellaceae bacterium]
MKDTVITARRKKTEVFTFIACIVVAIGLNIFAIAKYNTAWSELYSQIVYVLVIGCIIYALWTVLRLVFYGIIGLIRRL